MSEEQHSSEGLQELSVGLLSYRVSGDVLLSLGVIWYTTSETSSLCSTPSTRCSPGATTIRRAPCGLKTTSSTARTSPRGAWACSTVPARSRRSGTTTVSPQDRRQCIAEVGASGRGHRGGLDRLARVAERHGSAEPASRPQRGRRSASEIHARHSNVAQLIGAGKTNTINHRNGGMSAARQSLKKHAGGRDF
jgi:hypothetical protein